MKGLKENKRLHFGANMHFTMNYERTTAGEATGPVTVGWFLNLDTGAVIYDPPERLRTEGSNREHAKSAGRCPAVINMESRYFVIKSPIDLHLGFTRDEKGKPALINRLSTKSPVRANKLNQMISLTSESEWRFPNRPMIQMSLHYTFISDELVYLTQIAAFAHYRPEPLPGTIFGGRFPINVWPRPLMWAFEWHDTKKDLILKRGEPLFYCQFEADGPDRPVAMVEADKTPELMAYVEHISGAVNYVNQTFSLFQAAERARPESLLKKKQR